MPIYIPDSSKVIREMSPITVTTSDNVTREVAEAWHTGADGVNRLVYQNEVYLMQNGEWNADIVSGYMSTEGGYQSSVIKTDEGIKIHAQRGNASGSYPGYTYITLKNGSNSGDIQKEYLFNLLKNKKRICFDVFIYYYDKVNSDSAYGWVGLNPTQFEDKSSKFRTYQKSMGLYSFSGVLHVDIKGIVIEELKSTVGGMPIGVGVYCGISGKWVEITVKNIWLE
ncbi:hypothetical protein [Anaeromassilibacillus senegalensis]|uniref:hypothetical protein n=1 Tax=Anaeromassilibacillus senegalensis TaxID=1673717 RepID=UPI0006810414|nr:hypothetical protein [Anaeromassilibacillus senegalensis]